MSNRQRKGERHGLLTFIAVSDINKIIIFPVKPFLICSTITMTAVPKDSCVANTIGYGNDLCYLLDACTCQITPGICLLNNCLVSFSQGDLCHVAPRVLLLMF
jgi:hypothetical protein